jgi:hypothetical protein
MGMVMLSASIEINMPAICNTGRKSKIFIPSVLKKESADILEHSVLKFVHFTPLPPLCHCEKAGRTTKQSITDVMDCFVTSFLAMTIGV